MDKEGQKGRTANADEVKGDGGEYNEPDGVHGGAGMGVDFGPETGLG